jgi:hypothetical protein
MDPLSLIGVGGTLVNGLVNWFSGKKQNELMEKSLRQQAEELAARKQRWAQEDMMRKMLRLDMANNVRAMQRKTEEMAPIFDKQRNELEKLNESRFKTSSGEDIMVKANDMKSFLLDMVKNAIEKNNEKPASEHGGLDDIYKNLARHRKYIEDFKA